MSIIEEAIIHKEIAENDKFVHFTYNWYLENINREGLKRSFDGLFGAGIYCCKITDEDTIYDLIKFMEDEVNWHQVANYLGFDDIEDIPDNYIDFVKLIKPIEFVYSGEYYIAEGYELGKNITGYVKVPLDIIEPDKIQIGFIDDYI